MAKRTMPEPTGIITLDDAPPGADALRGENFVPSNRFKDIKMLEPPVRGPLHRGDMLIGYVFAGQLEQFAEGVVSPSMPISGPIFYQASPDGSRVYRTAVCAGCNEYSDTYTDAAHDKQILRWAREHRCKRRRELDVVVR